MINETNLQWNGLGSDLCHLFIGEGLLTYLVPKWDPPGFVPCKLYSSYFECTISLHVRGEEKLLPILCCWHPPRFSSFRWLTGLQNLLLQLNFTSDSDLYPYRIHVIALSIFQPMAELIASFLVRRVACIIRETGLIIHKRQLNRLWVQGWMCSVLCIGRWWVRSVTQQGEGVLDSE